MKIRQTFLHAVDPDVRVYGIEHASGLASLEHIPEVVALFDRLPHAETLVLVCKNRDPGSIGHGAVIYRRIEEDLPNS